MSNSNLSAECPSGLPTPAPLVSWCAVYCEKSESREILPPRSRLRCPGLAPKYDHEIVLVNDSARTARWKSSRPWPSATRTFASPACRGTSAPTAITAGIDLAAGDAVVIIDSDLQDPPEVVPQMVAKWERGFTVVYGVRTRRQGEKPFQTGHRQLLLPTLAVAQRHEAALGRRETSGWWTGSSSDVNAGGCGRASRTQGFMAN